MAIVDFNVNFESETELEILELTDFAGETLISRFVKVYYPKITQEFSTITVDPLISAGIDFILDLSTVTTNQFLGGIFRIVYTVITNVGEFSKEKLIFDDSYILACKKEKILELINTTTPDPCLLECEINVISTMLQTIALEIASSNYKDAETIYEYLSDKCYNCC